MKRAVTVIAMTGAKCNLACRYCYVSASRLNEKVFEPDNVETLVHNCSVGFDRVEFCWHGGEPLLAGMDFYYRVVAAEKDEQRTRRVEFQNNIQSNGILINDAWLQFFANVWSK